MYKLRIKPWVAVSTLLSCAYGVKAENKEHPNILMISVDDMADWVHCLEGHPNVKTPNIDRLAKRGILFTNAHCASPICGPSRAAIMTGMRPETSKVYHNKGTYIDYVPEAVAFPEYFRQNGYHVMGAGKINHASTKVVDKNWDEYGPGTGIVGTPFTDEELLTENMDPTVTVSREKWKVKLPMNGISTIDRPKNRWSTFDWGPLPIEDEEMPDGKIANWAVSQLMRQYDKPFFLGVGFYKPHQPLFAPQKYFDLYDVDQIELPPTIERDLEDLSQTGKDYARLPWTSGCHKTVLEHQQWKEGVRAYLATISFVDAQIGKVLDALDKSPHAKNTWIVFWSDHGWHLGEKEHWGKHTPWENATRVPFIIIPPAGTSTKHRNTLCNSPVNLVDLYPTLSAMANLPKPNKVDGNSLLPLVKKPKRKWDKVTVTTLGRGSHAITNGKWKYIHYYDGTQELYDLTKDPNEWVNLAAKDENRKVIKDFKKYIIDDPDIQYYVRMDGWKAIVKTTGQIMLFDIYGTNGISEQTDVAEAHPDVVSTIKAFLAKKDIQEKYVLIR